MQESMQRVWTWVKEHPYISGAILLGVILLGYLAYKRGAFSGSQAQDQSGAADNSGLPPESTAGTSPIPDMSSLGSPATSGGGVSTSGGDTGTNNQGESNYGGLGGTSVPLPLPNFQPTPALADLAPSALSSNAVSQLGKAGAGVKQTGVKKATLPATYDYSGGAPYRQIDYTQGHGGTNTGIGKASSGVKTTKGPQAPSTLYGKGPKYTGYILINGIQTHFTNGYPDYNTTSTQALNAMFGSPDR